MKTGTVWGALKCISMAKGVPNTWDLSFLRGCWVLVPGGDFYHLFCTPSFLSGQVCLFKVVIIKVAVGIQKFAMLFMAFIAICHSQKIAEVSGLCFHFPSFF